MLPVKALLWALMNSEKLAKKGALAVTAKFSDGDVWLPTMKTDSDPVCPANGTITQSPRPTGIWPLATKWKSEKAPSKQGNKTSAFALTAARTIHKGRIPARL